MRVTIKPAIWSDDIHDFVEVNSYDYISTTEDNASSACANFAIKYLRKHRMKSQTFEFWIIDNVYGELLEVVRYDYGIDTLD
jgi:hypothetical protein